MNTEELLKPIIEKAIKVAEQTGEFIVEQSPLLLQEFYKWHTIKHFFFGVVFLIFTAVFGWLTWLGVKKWDEWDELSMFPIGFGGVGFIIFLVLTIDTLYRLIFIHVAPKLYLIEYFLRHN